MARTNNYLIQARQAKQRFLTYDSQALIRKLNLKADEDFLYVPMLCQTYRIRRTTGDIDRFNGEAWVDANSYEEVMTLLDLVCDSREDRRLSGRWKNMSAFGLQFHQNLLEGTRDPWAEASRQTGRISPGLHRSGGSPSQWDIAYAIELFDGCCCHPMWLATGISPSLRLNGTKCRMYIRYETMYFAKALLLDRIAEEMKSE